MTQDMTHRLNALQHVNKMAPISVHADLFLSEHLIDHLCEEALPWGWAANSQLSSELVPTASIQHGDSGPLKLSTHNETMRHSEK